MSAAWEGDWQQRIAQGVVARGHRTVTEFAEAHPAVPLVGLGRLLGDNVAGEQIRRLLRAEAGTDPIRFERYARLCLVSAIRKLMRQGWLTGAPFEHPHVYGVWSSDVSKEHYLAVDRVFDTLVADAPKGWLPTGPDDPILAKAFERWAA